MTSANNNKGEDNMNNFTKDEVAKAYAEMGVINLAISQECFEAENEAWRLGDAYNEVDTKTGKGDT